MDAFLTVIFRNKTDEIIMGLVDYGTEIESFIKFDDTEKEFKDLTFNQVVIVSVETRDDGFKVTPLTRTSIEENDNKDFTIPNMDREELIGLCNAIVDHYKTTQLS